VAFFFGLLYNDIMKTRIDELWSEALDEAVPETYTYLNEDQLARVRAVFADKIVEMCADHILQTSDRYRKEYFAHKVLELRRD
jgi:hypothetical protein